MVDGANKGYNIRDNSPKEGEKPMKKIFAFAALALSLAATGRLWATEVTWDSNVTEGNWNDTNSWVGGKVPEKSDTAKFSSSATVTINTSGSTYCHIASIVIDEGATVTFKGSGNNNPRPLCLGGNITGSGKLRFAGGLIFQADKAVPEIEPDIEIVGETTSRLNMNLSESAGNCYFKLKGKLTGSGTLIGWHSNDTANYGIEFSGDNSGFAGVYEVQDGNGAGSERDNTVFANASATSASATWNLIGAYSKSSTSWADMLPTKPASISETVTYNFGAKVIYPPTIYPVCVKNIPIKVKNTFNPDAAGTIIKEKIEDDRKPIKGISSISGSTLITVTGLSMVGVIGVNRRIFTTLADHGISVFLVSQASSENSTSIGVRDEEAEEAINVLNEEFAKEIETGAMFPMTAEKGLATIAIVGENMKHTPGIAGKLFGTLGRSGISVIACAQGASETNISFVVDGRFLRKSLNVIHDSFFLSEYKVLNLFICGVGTVGSKLIEQIRAQYEELKQHSRLKLNVVGIATSHHGIFSRDGINLDHYREQLEQSSCNVEKLRDTIIGMNIFNSVFVDCTASKEISALYQTFLEHNISVIAANKIAASSAYDEYLLLKQTALARGVKFRFETNVGAGLPIIGTINDLRNSGDKILKIEAVLSGTLNFIFNELSPTTPFSKAVRMAKEQGYSEPDPRVDLSGTDVVRKLVILAREAGYQVEQADVEKHLFVPDSYFEGSLDDFWKNLPQLDADFNRRLERMNADRKRWRFVAKMENGKTSVALQEIEMGHPFYNLQGSNNIVMLTTERYKEFPMLIQGYGAGASVTAAGVFANIMSIANI